MVHPGNRRARSLKPGQSGVGGDFLLPWAAEPGDKKAMVNVVRLFLAACLASASVVAARAASPWDGLRAGLNREQVARALGVPVLRNAGRGHETWVYDAGASVQFHGGVVSAWTPPKSAGPAARAADAARIAQTPPEAPVNPARPPPASPRLS